LSPKEALIGEKKSLVASYNHENPYTYKSISIKSSKQRKLENLSKSTRNEGKVELVVPNNCNLLIAHNLIAGDITSINSSVNIQIAPKDHNPSLFSNAGNIEGFRDSGLLSPRYDILKSENKGIGDRPVKEKYDYKPITKIAIYRPIQGKLEVSLFTTSHWF
jgi:hypothetical protein